MTRKRLIRIFVFFLFTLFVSIHTGRLNAADKWVGVQSRSFLLVGDASESQMRRVGRNLEQFREAFSVLFPELKKRSGSGTTVVVFRNDESFKPYKPVQDGKPVDADAYFQGGEDMNYIAVTADPNAQFLVLHEYVHSLVKDLAGALPVWANEGLAEYYSTFGTGRSDRDFTIGKPIPRHIESLRSNTLIPLETLFGVTHDSPYYNESDKQGVFYAQSWALVHYFLNGRNRALASQFAKFVSLLGTDKPVDASFQEAFQKNYAAVEQELRDYIRRNTWTELSLVLDTGPNIDKEMKVQALSEAQSEYYLGDLLFHIQRLSEAETHLMRATMLDPKLNVAYASLGMLRVQQKKFPEALTLLKQAVASDSQNHLVHFYYADVLDLLNREDALPDADYASKDETMRTHLHKSIELNPSFIGAYGLLAQLNLLTGEELPETEALLNAAMAIAPGRQDLGLLLAQTMLRTQKTEQARALLTPIARGGADTPLRKQAEQILQNFDLYTGDRDAIRESLARRQITTNTVEPLPAAPSAPPAATRSAAPARGREPVLEALTPLPQLPDGEQITGLLTMMDCTSGLTLKVQTENETVDLRSQNPAGIQFFSYVPDVSTTITCGQRTPGTPVRVTYRKADREPLAVEFIEAK